MCRREDGGLRRVKKGREEPVGDEMVSLRGSPCNAPQPESISFSDNNLVNLARKVLRLIEFTCITTGCIPPPAFLTSTAVAITTMVAWKKSKYENSPLFFDLGDQRSNISPRSQLCASQSYCKQLRQLCFERTSWSWLSPTRARRLAASKTESCF